MSDVARRQWKARGSGSTAFLRAVTAQSYESTIVVDATGRIRYMSPSTRSLLGYDPAQVVGRLMIDFPHPGDRARVRRAFDAVTRAPGAVRTVEVRLRRADGEWTWAQARMTNMLDRPPVRGVVVNTVLIGDRKTLELRHAAAKLDPHFLYNVLHSVATMVREGQTAEAVEALARIRSLTEGTLGSAEDRAVPLLEEWAWVRDYLDLEQLRFGSDLILEIRDLPATLRDVPVPCRLIQPLVENAVKHGLRARPGGGILRVRADRRGDQARIRVIEEGQPTREEPDARSPERAPGFRIGLRTLRERLGLYFGDDARVALRVEPTRSMAVLTLPLDPATTPLMKQA